MLKVNEIRINYVPAPVGLESIRQVSWLLESDRPGVLQSAYRVQISENRDFTGIYYDTGWVEDGDSANRPLPGLKLQSACSYWLRVRVRCACGCESDWSGGTKLVTGFTEQEWKPCFITGDTEGGASSRGTCFRHEFDTEEVESAYLYATALGLYDVYLNGRMVGDEFLKPGWTSYTQRVLYQAWDVTDWITAGRCAIGAHVGAGWYKGNIGFKHSRNIYGEKTAFACRLVLRYRDGSCRTVDTDESWKTDASPVLSSEIYDGEIYDARREQDGWNQPGFDDGAWTGAEEIRYTGRLEPQEGARVKKFEAVPVRDILVTPKGEKVLDFGQNMSGTVTIRVSGAAGQTASLRFFEVLDAEGNVYLDNLRGVKQALTYTLRDGAGEYTPRFTFYGFRYALVESWPGELTKDSVTAYDLLSDMEPTGSFRCSNEDLNQLHHNVYWGMRGNFIDVPTDCPQRDERLGWTGDAQIFGGTACYLMNTAPFFTKWLRDLALEQKPDGGVPFVIPNVLEGPIRSENWKASQVSATATAWSDAAVILPWDLYQIYGDREIIRNQYDSMKAWVGYMTGHPDTEHWNEAPQFGDWVALDAAEGSYYGATPVNLIGMAYLAHTARLMSRMAPVAGREEDAAYYAALWRETRERFIRTYFRDDGSMTAMTQTAHVLALHFDLTPEPLREKTAEALCRMLEKNGGHLDTGFVGTPYICFALSGSGHSDEAYSLLLKEDFPSWLYQVKAGATTIWEHWDGLKPDGSMWSADMNSFNHYAYGAVAEWMYRVAAGLNSSEEQPGFRRSVIAPKIGGGLTEVEASVQTVYGRLASRWERKDGEVTLTVTVPCNTTAVIVPDRCAALLDSAGLQETRENGETALLAGSGTYVIRYRMA